MLYAATDTSAVPAVTNSLAFGSSSIRPLIAAQNFAIAAPTAASMLPIRLRTTACATGALRAERVLPGRGTRGRGLEGDLAGVRRVGLGRRGHGGRARDRRARQGESPLSMPSLWQHR